MVDSVIQHRNMQVICSHECTSDLKACISNRYFVRYKIQLIGYLKRKDMSRIGVRNCPKNPSVTFGNFHLFCAREWVVSVYNVGACSDCLFRDLAVEGVH